jgi:hypothetical protein
VKVRVRSKLRRVLGGKRLKVALAP